MKPIWKIIFLTALLLIGPLTGCNSAEKRDALNQENDINFKPVHYERKTNVNESNNDYKNRENRRFLHNMHDGTTKSTDDEKNKRSE